MTADHFFQHVVRFTAAWGKVNLESVFFRRVWQTRRCLAGIKDNRCPLSLGVAQYLPQPIKQRFPSTFQRRPATAAENAAGMQQVVAVYQDPAKFWQCPALFYQAI